MSLEHTPPKSANNAANGTANNAGNFTGSDPSSDAVWFVGGAVFLLVAVVVGASIGPAGPDWWRVPLELVNRLPVIGFDTGVTETEWAIVWKIRTTAAAQR